MYFSIKMGNFLQVMIWFLDDVLRCTGKALKELVKKATKIKNTEYEGYSIFFLQCLHKKIYE